MPAFLKPFLLSILAAALLTVSGCGYTWRGEENSSTTHSVLGDGSKTLRIRSVEQTTLYAWIPYIVRSQLRDEIAARGLAKWVDAAPSDFTIGVKILGCRMRSDNDLSSGMPNLVTATISMVFNICNGHTNQEIWSSGTIEYTDSFEREDERTVIQSIVRECIYRGVDRIQQQF